MTWRSFMEYALMIELGQEDAIQRNYALSHPNAGLPGRLLDKAFARMGFDQANTPRFLVLPLIRKQMSDMGYTAPLDDVLAKLAREWYIWDRIRKGDLTKWPLKPRDNPLI